MHPTFKARLLKRERLIGTVITLPVPELAEISADAGFDWLFLDIEHGMLDLVAVQRIAQAVGERCPLIVRVPATDDVWIKKVLDIGVAGIMVPQVNAAADAVAAVRRSKFAPAGVRGVGVGRASRYGAQLTEYLAQANEATTVIVQVEHIDAVRNVEQILEVSGVDAILIGPYDLSASMGKLGQVSDPDVQEAIERVRQVCLAREFPIGIFAGDAATAHKALEDGYTLLAVATDITLFAGVACRTVETLH